MNKADLIAAIAKASKLSKADSERALNATIDAIKGAVKKSQRVGIIGFGSFSVAQRKARTGRNPRTGKEIKIPAKKVVKFKPGSGLTIK